MAERPDPRAPHVPVLIGPILQAVAPVAGTWIDGTFGAGGYSRALLTAGAARVIGIDRDPMVFRMAAAWASDFGDRLSLVEDTFSNLDRHAPEGGADGVVLDLGVSSMQLDMAERGFSFMKDGPLDMRMSSTGDSAADLVNGATEAELADVIYHYGEDRAARRIARTIVTERAKNRIETTLQLAKIVEGCLPRAKPGQSHPATRTFQAIRIAVNAEFQELVLGMEAAERALKPGGRLAIVSFHSLEDRVVKRFLAQRSSSGGGGSRHAPEAAVQVPGFRLLGKAIEADAEELALNPRARSARLRVAERTDAPARGAAREDLGLPAIEGRARKW